MIYTALKSLTVLRYCRGCLLKSINIPFASAFSADGTIDHPSLRNCKGKIITIIGSCKDKLAAEVSIFKVGKFYLSITVNNTFNCLRLVGPLDDKRKMLSIGR